MNYLAHLHLAHYSNTSLPGALLGEYARGNIDPRLPFPLQLRSDKDETVQRFAIDFQRTERVRQTKVPQKYEPIGQLRLLHEQTSCREISKA